MVETEFDNENIHKKISLIISLAFHVLFILLILFWPFLNYDFPPTGKEGILVIFGETPESSSDEDINKSHPSESSEKKRDKEENKKVKPIDKSDFEKDLIDETEDNIPDQKTKDKPMEQESVPEKNINDAKNEFSKLFNSRGTKNSRSGQQGDPLGAQDAEILEGITRGKGKIGDGLDSRGILYEPNFEDYSQKSGRVIVKVCINELGNVISSKFTQRGSSTIDSELIAIAEKNAKKYRFTPSNKKEQCGTITIDFIVK